MDKFAVLREQQTSGPNYDIDNEAVVSQLMRWDELYGIQISDVGYDKVTVRFNNLPKDVSSLANEIYEFCPDTVDQGFGCYEEMIEAAEELDQEIPDHILNLTTGVDFSDDNYGVELLKRSLQETKTVALWWD